MAAEENLLPDFLERETAKIRRQEKLTWWIGIPLVAFVLVYMSYLSYQVDAVVYNPDNLARYAAGKIDEAAPDAIRSTEQYFLHESPALADQVIGEVYPMIDEVNQNTKRNAEIVLAALPGLEAQLGEYVDVIFSQHEDEVQTIFNSKNPEPFFEVLAEETLAQLEKRSEQEFQTTIDGKRVKGFLEISLAQLEELSGHIRELAGKRAIEMTPRERLERRVIAGWSSALKGAMKPAEIRRASRQAP